MVLLRGLNYDFSEQQSSVLTTAVEAGATTIVVDNNEGFADNDYILLDPYTENAEIVQVNVAVTAGVNLTITAAKFTHAKNIKIFRLAYNQMKFYESASVDGTYVAIAGATVDLSYADLFTNYDDTTGDTDYFFKRTFYNEETAVESDIDLAASWQASDEYYYITEEELRGWLQFGKNDFPRRDDMQNFIKLAQLKFDLDVTTGNLSIQKLGMLMLAKAYVLRALATKSVAKGYITVNAEGRTITKAYQELVLEAENVMQEYNAFLRSNATSEVAKTNFMDNSSVIDPLTRTKYIDNMTGLQNALDSEGYARTLYGRRGRY